MTNREKALLWLSSFAKNKDPMTLIPKQLIRLMYDALKEQDTKTGYWITEEPNAYTRRTYCSVCSKSAPFIYVSDDYYGGRSHGETKKTKYCPNCGAKMNI